MTSRPDLMNSKSFWAVILSVVVSLVLAGAYRVVFVLPARPIQTEPKPIVVDASRFPVTGDAGDAKVTLASVIRWERVVEYGDKVVRVVREDSKEATPNLTITSKIKGCSIVTEDCKALMGGSDVSWSSGGTSWSSTRPSYDYNASFPIQKGSVNFDLSYSYQSIEQGNSTKVVFKDVKVSSLPVSRKIGPITITLEKTYREHYDTGYSPFMIISTIEGPPDNFKGIFNLRNTDFKVKTSGAEPYWVPEDINVKIGDAGGGSGRGDYGKASEVFQKETEHMTRLESIIAKVNPDKASMMITNRAYLEAIKHTRKYRYEHNFDIKSDPKTFTWEATIYGPPKHRERNKVIFKNIPIPTTVTKRNH